MLHQWNKLGFWPHHLVAYVLVVIWYSTVRAFAVFRLDGDVSQNYVNSAIVMATLWVFATIALELMRQNLSKKIAIEVKLAVAMVIGAAISAFVGPAMNWVLGTSPPGLDIGTGRSDLTRFFADRYPLAFTGYLVSISPFWFVANWGWYAHRESSGIYSQLGQRRRPVTHADDDIASSAEETVTSMPPAFMRKLPPEKRGVLWAITAEQHYLRIYTSAGDDLILMRFSDALNELSSVDGLQIHRSHWVSAAGFKAFSEEDKRLFVVLQNDVVLPVSRPNYTAARQGFAEYDSENAQTDAAVSSVQSSTV